MNETDTIEDGRYSGCRWSELPDDYLDQLISRGGGSAKRATKEIRRRDDSQLPAVVADPAVKRIAFGKHKGQAWADLPSGYLEWIKDNFDDGQPKQLALAELIKRGAVPAQGACRKCGGLLQKHERDAASQAKAARKAKRYWFKWWWSCKACGVIYHSEAAKVIVGQEKTKTSTPKNADSLTPKRTEADWHRTHYQFKGPTGIVDWIPNGWEVAANELAPF